MHAGADRVICECVCLLTGVSSSDSMEELEELRVDGVNNNSDAADDVRDTDERGVSGSTSSHLRLCPVSDSSASRADTFSSLAESFSSTLGSGGSDSRGKAACHLPSVIGSNGCEACGLPLCHRLCSSMV